MDSVVKVHRSFLNEIRGFCNFFASMCKECYRPTCSCSMADVIQRAKLLIVMLDNVRDAEEERYFIENPHEEYMAKVFKAISQNGGEPVRSSEIRIEGESRQRKARALKVLLKRGRIRKISTSGEPIYVINKDDENKNNNKETANG